MFDSEDAYEFASNLEDIFKCDAIYDLDVVGAPADLLEWAYQQINWQEIAFSNWDREAWEEANGIEEEEEEA